MATSLALSLFSAGCASRGLASAQTPISPAESSPDHPGNEGAAHGFPVLRDLSGKALADGEFTQWVEDDDRLHVRIRYEFDASHWIEEQSVIQQHPTLVQETWSWMEVSEGVIQRRFEVDFRRREASAEKLEEGELRRWSESLSIEAGHAFAGSAWSLAIQGVRDALLHGETIEFQTVGFTPKPRAATVSISYVGREQVPMSGRSLMGDRFRIHPEIPWYAKLFVEVPDSWIWLAHPAPAAFLRWEGPLAEPEDELVRVDLLPGDPSGPASPWTH